MHAVCVCVCVCVCVLIHQVSLSICASLQACDGDTYRNEQCAATNNDSFNGQLYTWTEFDNARG